MRGFLKGSKCLNTRPQHHSRATPHMGLEQQTAHLQQHLVQQLQVGDTASLQACFLIQ